MSSLGGQLVDSKQSPVSLCPKRCSPLRVTIVLGTLRYSQVEPLPTRREYVGCIKNRQSIYPPVAVPYTRSHGAFSLNNLAVVAHIWGIPSGVIYQKIQKMSRPRRWYYQDLAARLTRPPYVLRCIFGIQTLDELSDARRGTAMQDERIEVLR